MSRGNFKACDILFHTSRVTQKLDVVVLFPFNYNINKTLYMSAPSAAHERRVTQEINIFNMCHLLIVLTKKNLLSKHEIDSKILGLVKLPCKIFSLLFPPILMFI